MILSCSITVPVGNWIEREYGERACNWFFLAITPLCMLELFVIGTLISQFLPVVIIGGVVYGLAMAAWRWARGRRA